MIGVKLEIRVWQQIAVVVQSKREVKRQRHRGQPHEPPALASAKSDRREHDGRSQVERIGPHDRQQPGQQARDGTDATHPCIVEGTKQTPQEERRQQSRLESIDGPEQEVVRQGERQQRRASWRSALEPQRHEEPHRQEEHQAGQ